MFYKVSKVHYCLSEHYVSEVLSLFSSQINQKFNIQNLTVPPRKINLIRVN